MHVGMLGTMAQMYLKDLAEKAERGQLGPALKGKIAAERTSHREASIGRATRSGRRGEESAKLVVAELSFW
jgi:hypothetical protein